MFKDKINIDDKYEEYENKIQILNDELENEKRINNINKEYLSLLESNLNNSFQDNYQFFELDIIFEFLRKKNVKQIVKIGSYNLEINKLIVDYCNESDSSLIMVGDNFDETSFSNVAFNFKIYEKFDFNIFDKINKFDAIFVDSDPNWYTTYHLLQLIEENNVYLPLIFICNNRYPYKRRDAYFNPDLIPEQYRNKCYSELPITYVDGDKIKHTVINDGFCHAIYQNTPKNGVLTAIEDYIKETKLNLEFMPINSVKGIYLLYDNLFEFYELMENHLSYFEGELLLDNYVENKLILSCIDDLNQNRDTDFKRILNEKNEEIDLINSKLKSKELLINNKNDKIDLINSKLKSKELLINNKNDKIDLISSELQSKNLIINENEKQINNDKKYIENLKKSNYHQISKLDYQHQTLNFFKKSLKEKEIELEYQNTNKFIKQIISPLSYIYLILHSPLKEMKLNIKLYTVLKKSDLFNVGYYLNKYPDVYNSKWSKFFSPQLHYICCGFEENRKFNRKYHSLKDKRKLLKELKT